MSLKSVSSSLPKSGWDTLHKLITAGASASDVSSSGVLKTLVGLIKKNKEMDKVAQSLATMAGASKDIGAMLITNKVLEALQSANSSSWSTAAKTSIASMLRHLALAHQSDTFRAFPLIIELLNTGPDAAQEEVAAALQALAYNAGLKQQIVDSVHLADICKAVDTSRPIRVQRCCMAALNNLSVSSHTTGLDAKMFKKGVLETVVSVMKENDDGEVLKHTYCFTRNITLAQEDVKAYLTDNGAKCIFHALQHSAGPVREHSAGLIRNLGTNGSQANARKNAIIDAGVIPVLVKTLKNDQHAGAKLQAAYALWNLSNSTHGAKTIMNMGLVPEILEIYEPVTWDDKLNNEVYKSKLVGVLCCLCANAGEDGCNKLREHGLQNHLHPLMMSKDASRQPINAACGLANLVGHLENHPLLEANTTIFEMICECIEATRKGQAYHGAYYSEWGLVRNLANMSVSDSNKPLLKKTKSVECACRGFRVGAKYIKHEDCVAKLISNMSFAYNLETDFDVDVMSIVRDIKDKSKSPEARKMAEVALFQQKFREEKPADLQAKVKAAAASSGENGHVMISYPWKWQPQMVALKKFLEDNGVSCWFDLDDMSGSTLDAMATAVEGACAVIVCLSSEYKESAACRSEGEYAFNLKKPIVPVKVDLNYHPDGWLGMLLGSKLYFDVSSDSAMATNGPSLLKEVLKHYKGKSGPQPGGHSIKPPPPVQTPTKGDAPKSVPSTPAPAPTQTAPAAPGVSADVIKTILDSFLTNLEKTRENITKHVDERFNALDERVRALERKVFKK
ncbi:hypothetical protein PTSG_00055 [Salpingoeca rosetta]|uniref:TIR domain-containing protein n=1 Tax=Salpingoeca rosetta (strain ATCC 50818 / BSB-021) TaxID=946362 RepID=F2TVE2_SALR5|nr:uncharacterized protein PTSG_00055 [Salpingoeca rosetta]EGD72038.1 hypothetical protein PTSG_00055 [Salpingoeca rosetta]|eukprot:XP_004998610.1 hypothetical protein PTSG_00055 [Salpingoeca rosetta]